MSGATDSDLLMYFVQSVGSDPVKADSTSDLTGADTTLMTGFVAGHYFEAENFTFSIKLADDEGGGGSAGGDSRSFARWRGLRDNKLKPSPPFHPDPEEVSISRMIDRSSPILLQYCLDTKPFETVVLVKRARLSTGQMSVIMRMEFSKVWITAIEWEDGDAVMESCRFKFTSVDVKYVRRKPDGQVDGTFNCGWSARPHG